MPTIQLIISGKVQGVYFRASAKEKADSLGLKGWVRNTRDGNVELVASGHYEKLAEMRDWCSHGPAGARVERVEEYSLQDGDFDSFEIRR